MLHKAYENQAENWNLSDSAHGMVRHGDLEGIQQLSRESPAALYVKDGCGANILHQSLLINGAKQRQIACWLLDNHGDLLEQPYSSDVFEGEVGLHFPIVHRDVPLARLLLARYPEALRCRARGTFFQDPAEGCFFGEYPVMFAASTNQPDLVTTFLEVGERCINLSKSDHLQFRDNQHNTIFHLCVHHNLPDMYDFVEQLCTRICPEFISGGMHTLVNAEGFTPFTLAAKLGREEIFNHLLKRCSITEWSYGPVNCRKVALIELDRPRTADPQGKGVLQILEEEGHSRLLMHPLIQQLQQEKWDKFAGRYFMNRVLIVAAFLEMFFLANVMRSGSDGSPSLSLWVIVLSALAGIACKRSIEFLLSESPSTSHPDTVSIYGVSFGLSLLVIAPSVPVIAKIAEVVVLCGALWKGIREFREMWHNTVQEYFSGKGAQLMENILSLCYVSCVITATAARYFSQASLEDLTLAFASLTSWAYVLWLLLGFRKTGPFVIMIWKMLLSDLIRFLIIFAAFLFGFAQTFFILFDESGFERFMYRVHVCFVALLGQAELDHDTGNRFPLLSTSLLLVYVLLVSILLLNLLVAMMSSTYTEIQEEAEEVWRLQWTRLIFSIESEMSPDAQNENTYWTELEGPNGKLERYLVASNKKVGEEDIRAYFNPTKTGKRDRVRPPSMYVEESELHDVLEDPDTDAAYAEGMASEYEAAYPLLAADAISNAAQAFSEGTTPPNLVQLLVCVSFSSNGRDLIDLLSKYYFGASPPLTYKARSARFLAALLFTQGVKVSEVRARLQSFSINPSKGLPVENWPALQTESVSSENEISL
eukprot:TRINITY_DN2458_c0_g1_i1.p1 TRINITY_DN2458_c0_g1~~TRINITY_DN2458_c0_g1_i1.p1  ORF type:complete len:961 (+),score=160.78 TRINITY_DN2458_c0_g1_i1:423-2885(+)